MRVLVTGVGGFIGSNFAKQFKDKFPGCEIVGIDNFSTGRRDSVPESVTLYEGSIIDETLLEQIFSTHKPEYVFHFAALPRVSYSMEYPVKTTEINVGGTVAMLNVSKNHGVKRFIFSSSSSVYGGAKTFPTNEEHPLDPKSPYAAQKLHGEIFCKVFSNSFELDTVCLRYFNVYGPGQYGDSAYSTVISAWFESLFFPENKKSFIEGDGSKSRDFCYVDNVVLANILAMQSDKPFVGEAFNVAHGERTTVNEVRSLIEQHTGKKLNLEQRPDRAGDVAHTHADISKAKEHFGYEPVVKFVEGIKKTVEWFEERIKR